MRVTRITGSLFVAESSSATYAVLLATTIGEHFIRVLCPNSQFPESVLRLELSPFILRRGVEVDNRCTLLVKITRIDGDAGAERGPRRNKHRY
jgi:hypothetical protein